MYKHNEGGKPSHIRGNADCGVRAYAIATGTAYLEARKILKEFAANGKQGNRAISRGIYKEDMSAALQAIGWAWHSAPKFTGRKARAADLPKGKQIALMAKHFVAVIDNVVHDSWDSSEKMVYGYWAKLED